MELISGEIGTIGPHPSARFFTEFVNADRAQGTRSDDFAPVLVVFIGPASVRWFGISPESRLGRIHQVSHDGIERYQVVSEVTVGAVSFSKSGVVCGRSSAGESLCI